MESPAKRKNEEDTLPPDFDVIDEVEEEEEIPIKEFQLETDQKSERSDRTEEEKLPLGEAAIGEEGKVVETETTPRCEVGTKTIDVASVVQETETGTESVTDAFIVAKQQVVEKEAKVDEQYESGLCAT